MVVRDTGLQSLELGNAEVESLWLFDNLALSSLNGLQELSGLQNLVVSNHPSLVSLEGLKGLMQLDELQLVENRQLGDGASLFLSLEEVSSLSIEDCAFSTVLAAASGCQFNPPCASLETALREDVCMNVQSGCGLVHVNRGPGNHSWYEDFGGLPVGLSEPPVTSANISCDAVEVSC